MRRLALAVSVVFALALTPCLALADEGTLVPEACACGASWDVPKFDWEDWDDEENWWCTATLICQNEECEESLVYSTRDFFDEDGMPSDSSPFGLEVGFEAPTCTVEGYEYTTWYLFVYIDGVLEKCEDTKRITYEPAHDWMVSIEWEDYFDADNWNFTVTQSCWGEDCGQTNDLTENATFNLAYVVEPTCTEYGLYEGTVSIECEGELYEDVKTVEVEPLGHDYDENGVCGQCGDEKDEAPSDSAPAIPQTGDKTAGAAVALAALVAAGCAVIASRKIAA